jgi:hypothetical protein
MRVRSSWTVWLAASLCVVCVLTAGLTSAQAPGASPPDAKAILLKMGTLLGSTERLSVTAHAAYDAVQPSGLKIEWNETRTLTLHRPGRLRMEGEKSNGARSLVIFDGRQISTFDEVARAYAQAAQPGGIDETLVYFVRDLGIRFPLAALFASRVAADLARRVKSVEYVEKTGIFGAPAHHLVGKTDSVEFQVWITDGDRPLPQRIVLTYPSAAGQPEFRVQFSAWNLNPETPDSLFAFTPPDGATRIPFASALPRYSAVKKGAKP